MSNYSERRAQNLAAHDLELTKLAKISRELIPVVQPPSAKRTAPASKATSNKRPKTSRSSVPTRTLPTRSSARTVQNLQTEEQKALSAAAEKKAKEAEAAEVRRRKHESRKVEALTSVKESGDDDSLQAEFKALSLSAKEYETTWFKGPAPPVYPDKGSAKVLEAKLGALEHRGTIKVTDARVYSLNFHPDPNKDIIISGDKEGNIGMWDATSTYCDYDGLADQRGRSWYWKAHQRTVSVVKFAPVDAHHLYSSSYDCTVRRLNFETGVSEEILDGDRWDKLSDNLVHAFDFDPTGQTIWAVDNGGGMMHRDMREPIHAARRWTVDRGKIGGFSINPVNPNIAVTGHLKHDLRVWDLKKLLGMPDDDHSSAAYGDDFSDCVVATYEHTKACSSTYFDRSGTKILTTSYDDVLRVFDINPRKPDELRKTEEYEPSVEIEHNNQTGAYVSVFRAQFSTCPTLPLHIHVANMGRKLDIFSPYPEPQGDHLVQLTDESITAVPAVTASHPTRAGRYAGGNASGKISFWAPPNEDMPTV